jgi:hypothetical protein
MPPKATPLEFAVSKTNNPSLHATTEDTESAGENTTLTDDVEVPKRLPRTSTRFPAVDLEILNAVAVTNGSISATSATSVGADLTPFTETTALSFPRCASVIVTDAVREVALNPAESTVASSKAPEAVVRYTRASVLAPPKLDPAIVILELVDERADVDAVIMGGMIVSASVAIPTAADAPLPLRLTVAVHVPLTRLAVLDVSTTNVVSFAETTWVATGGVSSTSKSAFCVPKRDPAM